MINRITQQSAITMKCRSIFFCVSAVLLFSNIAVADISKQPQQIVSYAEKLETLNLLPRLLPVILANSDVIELNDEQLNTLLEWRKTHRDDMIATMNEIANKRINFKQAALSPDVSSARLIQMQNAIFRLQRKVLQDKLSCRELVINSFNSNNWEGFFLVLADMELGVALPESYMTKQ